MANMNYHDRKNAENMVKLREIMTTLPHFCREFFLGIKDTTSTRTRLAYAYDLRMFFEYLHDNHPRFKNTEITEFEVEWLDDDWTVVAADGLPSAHYENTILVTTGEPEILTLDRW